jgi:hypothetical protein
MSEFSPKKSFFLNKYYLNNPGGYTECFIKISRGKIKDQMNKILLGSIIGLVVSGLIIYSIDNRYNFIQVLIGFLVFIFPSIFLSSFKSRTASVFLTIVVTSFIYISFKFNYFNTWPGVLIALSIGLPLYFIKISKIK